MTMLYSEIEEMIQASFPTAKVELTDMAGDGDHYAIIVEAQEFANKTKIQQHKMVYAALQGSMHAKLHALSITTRILSERTINESKKTNF